MKNSFARKNARRIIALGNFSIMTLSQYIEKHGENDMTPHLYAKYVDRKLDEKAALESRVR